MREPRPYYKASHKCWYVNIDGKQHRLDPDEAKARKLYHQLMNQARDAEAVATPNAKVVDHIAVYLDWVEKNRAADTYAWYRKHLDSFAKHIGPKLRTADLKQLHVTRWLSDAHAENGDGTKRGAITAVKRCFNWLADEGYIKDNPVGRMKRPRYIPRGDEAYITTEQWDKLVAAINDGQRKADNACFIDIVTVLRESGCRPQEIVKVEARYLNHENRQWVFPQAKSKGKIFQRIVPLNDTAYEICRRLSVQHPEGPIFRNADGQPWTAFSVHNRFDRLAKKTGFKVTAYNFRHTFCTDKIVAGVPLPEIAAIMGHSDMTMILNVYQHYQRATTLAAATKKAKRSDDAAA